jgi:hypothetical protein
MVHSILSLYGDDHVLDDKSKYKVLCFSLKEVHICVLVSPQSVDYHSTTSYLSIFTPG